MFFFNDGKHSAAASRDVSFKRQKLMKLFIIKKIDSFFVKHYFITSILTKKLVNLILGYDVCRHVRPWIIIIFLISLITKFQRTTVLDFHWLDNLEAIEIRNFAYVVTFLFFWWSHVQNFIELGINLWICINYTGTYK